MLDEGYGLEQEQEVLLQRELKLLVELGEQHIEEVKVGQLVERWAVKQVSLKSQGAMEQLFKQEFRSQFFIQEQLLFYLKPAKLKAFRRVKSSLRPVFVMDLQFVLKELMLALFMKVLHHLGLDQTSVAFPEPLTSLIGPLFNHLESQKKQLYLYSKQLKMVFSQLHNNFSQAQVFFKSHQFSLSGQSQPFFSQSLNQFPLLRKVQID